MTEAELISSLKAGDEYAFGLLVELYQQGLGNVCFGFVQNQTDAEELVQEVFVEVFRSVGRFEGKARLSTWLYRIAVNKSINFVKKQRRRRTLAVIFGSREGAIMELADSESSSAQQELEKKEVRKALKMAIDKLPENQRTAIILRQYEQHSYAEIAAVMGTTVSAVESLLHRATGNLRKHLEGFYRRHL